MEGIIIAIIVGWLLSYSMREKNSASRTPPYECENPKYDESMYDGVLYHFRFGMPRDILLQTLNDIEETSSKQFLRGLGKYHELWHIVDKMHPEYKVKIWLPQWIDYLCRWHIKEKDEHTKSFGYMDFDVFIASRISENFERSFATKTIDDEFPVFIKEDYTKRDPENYPCFID